MNKMDSGVHYTSNSVEWATPQYIVDWCANRFLGYIPNCQALYVLDVAATTENKKATCCFTILEDGLTQHWGASSVWLNPPYGRVIGSWIDKALSELEAGSCRSITLLVPGRTDTKWFDRLVNSPFEKHVVFVKGRIAFGGKSKAPFPSVIVHLEYRSGETITTFEEVKE